MIAATWAAIAAIGAILIGVGVIAACWKAVSWWCERLDE